MKMLSALRTFDELSAVGVLSRLAFSIDNEINPAGFPKLPEEISIRKKILNETINLLGIDLDDNSPLVNSKIIDFLDNECDKLIANVDEDQALKRLSNKGELPSDLYNISIIPNIADFYGDKYFQEEQLIIKTVKYPDQEKHFGISSDQEKPSLISLFLKFIPNIYIWKSFNMLVVGQRSGIDFEVHQTWRLYKDIIDIKAGEDLVDVLRNFAEKFGANISVGNKTGKFILITDIPKGEIVTSTFKIENNDLNSKNINSNKDTKNYSISHFMQNNEIGNMNSAALVMAIDLSQYEKYIKLHGW